MKHNIFYLFPLDLAYSSFYFKIVSILYYSNAFKKYNPHALYWIGFASKAISFYDVSYNSLWSVHNTYPMPCAYPLKSLLFLIWWNIILTARNVQSIKRLSVKACPKAYLSEKPLSIMQLLPAMRGTDLRLYTFPAGSPLPGSFDNNYLTQEPVPSPFW